jgi:hypothetical protein
LGGSITQAVAQAASGKPADVSEAWTRLNILASEASAAGFSELKLEADLALGELELRTGKASAGRARLEALRKESDEDGVVLVSLKASAAIRSLNQAEN